MAKGGQRDLIKELMEDVMECILDPTQQAF